MVILCQILVEKQIFLMFNDFFASIFTPIKNSSVLPPLTYRTNEKLNSLRIYEQDILLIIKAKLTDMTIYQLK